MDSELLKLNSNYDIKIEILKATTALVDEVPFDKLTIGAICKAANISRTTFYRYFDDKFAVAQWYANYAFAQGTNEIGVSLPWYEGYYITEVLMTDQVAFSKGSRSRKISTPSTTICRGSAAKSSTRPSST